jgi:hypothetical protein
MLRIANVIVDCADLDLVATFWAATLGYQYRGHDGRWAEVVHPLGVPPSLHFQKVPEPKVVKNRVHLDVQADDREAEVRRLTELGARALRTVEEDGDTWTVMADPEGNEFCVVA